MMIIAGLGNPGSEYVGTRHNIGYQVVEAIANSSGNKWKLAKQLQCEVIQMDYVSKQIRLAKSTTYMNHSGQALSRLASYYKLRPEQLIVVHDDVGLPLGQFKLSINCGDGGHNGIADIIQHLGKGFIRFRIGVGSKPEAYGDLKTWVLGRFSAEENTILQNKMNDFIAGMQLLLRQGLVSAMNVLNTRKKKEIISHESDINKQEI